MLDRLLRIVVVGLVCIAAAASAVAAIKPAPLGLDVNGREFALVSNGGWKVSVNGSGKLPSKEVQKIRDPVPGGTTAFDRQKLAYIWAKTCTDSKQTLTFRRTYFLPGPAKSFGVNLNDTVNASPPNATSISSVKILVNGKVAASAPGAYLQISAAPGKAAKLFKFGNNDIEVVVVKRPRNGVFGRCSTSGTPPRPLGVYFNIFGQFEADLWLSKAIGSTTEIFNRMRNGQNAWPFRFKVDPRNLGPSGIYKGTLTVNITASTVGGLVILEDTLRETDGVKGCKVTMISSFQAKVECLLSRVGKGDKPSLSFIAGVTLLDSYDVAWVLANTLVGSPTADPKPQTNGWQRRHWLCHHTSTDSRCPPP